MRKHLVVVIPGIGGSVLCDGPDPGTRTEIWSGRLADVLGVVRHPQPLSLDAHPSLTPTGLIPDSHLLPGWAVIHGYSRLIRRLAKLPGARLDAGDPATRDESANIVLFPYDFRLGVARAAEALQRDIGARLAMLSGTGVSDKVIIVAHSMGGLVARYWLGPLQGWPTCRALITLGTPHRGAPKALSVATRGLRAGPIRLTSMSDVLSQWPGLHDLFPTYRGIHDTRDDRWLYAHELPLPLASAARASFDLHESIRTSWEDIPRKGPQSITKIGWSHPTPTDMRWDGTRLEVTSDPTPLVSTELGWGDLLGDGTVPAFSAVPSEMSETAPGGMLSTLRHGPLAADQALVDMLGQFETYGSLAPVRDAGRLQHTLGLDLPEMAPSGPVPLRVLIHGPEPAQDPVAVWYRISPAGRNTILHEGRLDPDGPGSYVGAPTLTDEGMYDVTITATGVAGEHLLRCQDLLMVVDT